MNEYILTRYLHNRISLDSAILVFEVENSFQRGHLMASLLQVDPTVDLNCSSPFVQWFVKRV